METINAADPLITREVGPRGPRRVDPGTQADHHPKGYQPTDVAEVQARDASFSQPGRYSDVVTGDKPGPDDTPYRSRWFVVGRHSADGNDYAVGEPIPQAEATRQGLALAPVVLEAPTLVAPPTLTAADITDVGVRDDLEVCPKCRGLKKSPKMYERHGPEIGHCPACRGCNVCNATGYVLRGAPLGEGEVVT